MESRLSAREAVIRSLLDKVAAHGEPLDPHLHYLCLDEALINAIVHGNKDDPTKTVRVRAFLVDDGWGVEVCDEGSGFDWPSWKKRLSSGMDLSRTQGRGLELIFNSGGTVEFLDGGSRLRIVWRQERNDRQDR